MKIRPGIYHHFKNTEHLYEIVGIALDTESKGEVVIYRPLYENEHALFARPLDMFLEEVDKPELGYKGPRFVFVRETL